MKIYAHSHLASVLHTHVHTRIIERNGKDGSLSHTHTHTHTLSLTHTHTRNVAERGKMELAYTCLYVYI